MSERAAHERAILAEIPWLRQLARELVGDANSREDLVQETCWIALSQPPRGTERASLRAWLRTVIRNASRLANRSRSRVLVRERSSSRPEAIEPVDEIVARAELQRRLLTEVLALRQPLREVLILRYYRGLDTATIARELDLSEEAVRQRQARALAALRERTQDDAGLRDLLSISGVLRPAARISTRALRWSAAACCLLVAAAWIPQLFSIKAMGPALPSLLAAGTVEATVNEPTTTNEAGAAPRTPAQEPAQQPAWLRVLVREARGQAGIQAATISRARAKNWDELAADVGACIDRLGISGKAGRYLSLSNEELLPSQPGTQDLPPFSPRDESVIATTDREGRVELSAKLQSDEYLVVRSADHGARFISVADAVQLTSRTLTVDLHPLGKLPVRVHTLEGDAIDEAFLRLEAVPFLPEFQPQPALPLVDGLAWNGPTDKQGKFELEGVPFDESLIVTPLSRYIGSSNDALLPAGTPAETLNVLVVASGAISGRIVDAKHHPIASATVRCRPRQPWSHNGGQCMTDEGGVFTFAKLPAGVQTLEYSVKGGSTMSPTWADGEIEVTVEPFASIDIGEIVLEDKVHCSGRLIGMDIDGRSQGFVELIQRDKRTRVRPSNTGKFDVEGDAGPARLEASLNSEWGPGRTIAGREVSLPCEGLEFDVSSRLASVVFRLGDLAETPPKLCVRLYDHATRAKSGPPRWEGADTRYDVEAKEGIYRVGALPPGNFRIEIHGPQGREAWSSEIQLEAAHSLDLGAIHFGSGVIEGSLLAAHGKSEVCCVRRMVVEWGADGFDRRSVPLAEDGSFRFANLPAGFWCVTATCDGVDVVNCRMIDLRADRIERLELTASKASSISCRIRNGLLPVVGARAQYAFATDGELQPFFELNPPSAIPASDSQGRIELGTFFPGSYLVRVQVGEQSLARRVDVAWGEQVELEFDLAWPEIAVSLDLPDDLLARMDGLAFYALDDAGAASGLQLSARRTGVSTFLLRAPPCKGYVELSLQEELESRHVQLPIILHTGQARVSLSLPPGEMLLHVGGGERGTWGVPEVTVVELSTGKIPGCDSWLDRWPLDPIGAGLWIARGIPAGATLLLRDADRGPGYGSGPRIVHFESGRLELNWP